MPFDAPLLSRRSLVTLLSTAALSLATRNAPGAKTGTHPDSPLSVPDRGINIPLWLDQPDGSGRPPSSQVLQLLADLGFEHIRLPMDPDPFLGNTSSPADARARLRAAIKRISSFGFSLTLDMHPSGAIGTALESDPKSENALNMAWDIISRIAADTASDRVFFELLNEPPLWQDRWLPLRDRLAATIRNNCPEHTLIWGANRYQTISETISSPPLADANAIAAVHYYSPLAFTHQCQTWGEPANPALHDLPFPATPESPEIIAALGEMDPETARRMKQAFGNGWNGAQIRQDFALLGEWARTTGTPVILNEFATLKFCTDTASRARWTRAVRRAAEASNIGWTYWEMDRGFGFLDSRTAPERIDTDIIDALFEQTEAA